MAIGGQNASFQFAGTTYNADDCLQSWDLQSSINDVVYQCNGYDKHASGTKAISFRTSLAFAATDSTKHQAFTPGTTGAFEAHPAGDTATYIEITASRATVISAPMSAPVNGIISLDIELALDDVTYTTAA